MDLCNGSKCCPVKVIFGDVHDAMQILKQSTELGHSPRIKNIPIPPSHARRPLDELYEKKKSEPRTDYIICKQSAFDRCRRFQLGEGTTQIFPTTHSAVKIAEWTHDKINAFDFEKNIR